jgi:hypothetical protein
VGYIFFRAENIVQAMAMLKAIISPHTYTYLSLDRSLYWMTLLAAVGYFAVIGAGELLNRLGQFGLRWAEKGSGGFRTRFGGFLGVMAQDRWVWIAPVVLVLMLYLSVIVQPGHAETGPVMYALF